ncbi:MAG: MYXO-CTERM sorting domain-containing protein [Planctomycetota bacterium]
MQSSLLLTASVVAGLAATANAADISVLTLPEGGEILQITGAVERQTPGGPAVADTRTVYQFAPDFDDPQPNDPDFTGSTWGWVYLESNATLADLVIPDEVTADFSLLTNPDSALGLQWVLVNGNPLYQFVNDTSPTDANGNFGPWFFTTLDGSPTQAVPEPGVAALGLAAAGVLLRRRR